MLIRLSMPPRLAARLMTFSRSYEPLGPFDSRPSRSKQTIPPNPVICRLAIS